jgi:hypothetical protein
VPEVEDRWSNICYLACSCKLKLIFSHKLKPERPVTEDARS